MTHTLPFEIEVTACPICATRERERTFLDQQLPARFVRCAGCSSVYLNPRPAAAPRAAYYQRTDRALPSQLRVAESRRTAFRAIASALLRYQHAGACLDVGCGPGALFEHLPRTSWRCHGIEPDPDLAAYAASAHGARVHAGTLDDAPFTSAQFDLVTLIDTLYLLPDPLAALRKIHGLLRPGGVLGLEFAGQRYMLCRSVGPLNYLLEGRWSRLRADGRHLYFFTPRGIETLLSMAGFTALEWTPLPGPGHRLFRLAARCSFRLTTYCPKLLCVAART
jgi:SAM-dependent methyltransferase